jgi:lipopolysaccharide export system permease protein
MTQIDRYVLFLYSRVFVICFLTLAGLLVVVQVFTNLDELIAFGETRGGFVNGLVEYFSPYLLSIYDRMCGLIAMLSTMFVVAWLYRTHEMTALLAAGISKGRIVRPILILSAVLIGIAAVSRELFIPHFAGMLSKSPQDLKGENVRPIRPAEDVEQGVLIAGMHLLPAKSTIVHPIFRFLGPAAAVTQQITGASAVHLPADSVHPAGYLVAGAKGSDSLTGKKSVRNEAGSFLLLPADNPWLQPHEVFIPSKIEYDVLRGGGARQFASTGDLIWRMQNQGSYYGSELKVAVHARFVQPFLDFTQLLLGIPLILSNRNRNLVSMILTCLISFAAFFGVSMGLNTLGANETFLSPAVAAWAPLLIFGPFAWAQSANAMRS